MANRESLKVKLCFVSATKEPDFGWLAYLGKDSIQSISHFALVEEETRIKSTIFKQ
jgi:hypothetical protein